MKCRYAFVLLLAVVCWCAQATAGVNRGYGYQPRISEIAQEGASNRTSALDTRFVEADLVATGKLISIEKSTFPLWLQASVELREVYKGTASGTIKIAVRADTVFGLLVGLPSAEVRQRTDGSEWLCFLHPRPNDAEPIWIANDQVEYPPPKNCDWITSLGPLTGDMIWIDAVPGTFEIASDMHALRAGWEIRKYLHERSKELRAISNPSFVNLIWRPDKWMKPVEFMEARVPIDVHLETAAESWMNSADPLNRLNAIRVFASTNTPAHGKFLKELLDDPYAEGDSDEYKFHSRTYVLRLEAYVALQGWNVTAPRPTIDEPKDAYIAISPYAIGGGILALLAILTGLSLMRQRLESSAFLHGFRVLRALLFLLCLMVVFCWHRSQRVVYQLEFDCFGRRVECCNAPDGFQITLIRDWPLKTVPAIVALPRGDADQLWDLPRASSESVFHTVESQWIPRSAGTYRGFTAKVSPFTGFSWNRFGMPYPWLMVATALLPSLGAVTAGVRRIRRRPNCCHKCGYDLRATKDRCPECGTPVPPRKKNWRQVVREQMRVDEEARKKDDAARSQLADQFTNLQE